MTRLNRTMSAKIKMALVFDLGQLSGTLNRLVAHNNLPSALNSFLPMQWPALREFLNEGSDKPPIDHAPTLEEVGAMLIEGASRISHSYAYRIDPDGKGIICTRFDDSNKRAETFLLTVTAEQIDMELQ